MKRNMIINVKLSEKEYIQAGYTILWANRLFRFFALIIWGSFLYMIIISPQILNSNENIFKLGIFPLATIVLVVYTYFSLKKAYVKNDKANETVTYHFSESHLFIGTSNSRAEIEWQKIVKLTKSRNWILIWQNVQIANAIPKRAISIEELHLLKEILTKNGVKNNL